MSSDDAAREAGDGFLEEVEAALEVSVGRLKESPFFRDLTSGRNVRALYAAYLREAYHFVRLTSSFTPLAARRMDPALLELRRWILTHSAEELGHESMALADLQLLGSDPGAIEASAPGPGTVVWVSFFHYHVAMANPFAALGVLYFLEGMAAALAPAALGHVLSALRDGEKRAISFFREHGALDVDHVAQQRALLARFCTEPRDREAVLSAVRNAGYAMRAFLDALAEGVEAAGAAR